MASNHKPEDIIKPVDLAREIGIKPQIVFGWIRNKKIPAHQCICGHNYLLRSEVETFLKQRAEEVAEKERKEKERIEAELRGEKVSA
jgi:hypothetical protein